MKASSGFARKCHIRDGGGLKTTITFFEGDPSLQESLRIDWVNENGDSPYISQYYVSA